MQKSDLLRHNVSHLVVFQSLLRTMNVTATASALHMSQPAVSRALSHLREMFGDPLFVRGPGGMVPTERARQLADRVSDLVDDLADLIVTQDFDPHTTDRIFRIATTDYGAGTVILEIMRRFSKAAPKAGIELVPFPDDQFRNLSLGRLDLVLYPDQTLPESLRSAYLFEERYVCVCRKGHPILKQARRGAIPMAAFLDWPHALVTVFGGRFGLVDRVLKKQGLNRHIAMRLPYFSTAPVIVAKSDMLLTLPSRTARHFATLAKLEQLEAPVEIPAFGYTQVWHPRSDHDPAMLWLRDLIQSHFDP